MGRFAGFSSETFIERTCENGGGFILQYSILCTQDPVIMNPELNVVYSLLIVKHAAFDEVERFFAYDITRNAEKALHIIDMMHNNSVTPCTAYEILEELL